MQCLIVTGGLVDCFDEPAGLIAAAEAGTVQIDGFAKGWILWPPIPYSYRTIVDVPGVAPAPPSDTNWLGTDDTKRDVVARVIYGFRLSVFFAIIVTLSSSLIGIVAGAVQGYFGGWTDLMFQRFIEIWTGTPSLYVIIIIFAILGRSFWLLVFLDGAVRLAGAGRRGARRIPAGAQLRICPRRAGAGRVATARSCSATCCPMRWWRR